MRHTARPPPPWPGEERGRECRRGRPAPRSPPPRAPAAPRTASSSRISKTRLALPRSPSTASRLAASAGRAMLCWGSSAQSGAGTARLRGGATRSTGRGRVTKCTLYYSFGWDTALFLTVLPGHVQAYKGPETPDSEANSGATCSTAPRCNNVRR